MYRITADNNTLWSPGFDKKKLASPKLSLETNKIGSLSFTIYPDHANYNDLVKMQSIVTVYQGEDILFKGRIFSDNGDFRKAKKVEVEGLLGYFNDSIVRPYSYQGSVSGYLEFLITQHNSQEPEKKQFKLGVVTVTDPNDYITRASSDYPKTWDEINDKLIKLLGGYIKIRYEEDGNYIDYLADFTSVSPQKIQYAVNLLDLNNEVKADNLATCIIPLGASLQDEEGNSTRVTIESVNDGLDYVYDQLAELLYGRISKVVTWDDVTEPSNLLTKAKAYLATSILLEGTLTIKAVDLHLSDKQIQAFRIGQYINVYSAPHGINENMLLNSFSLDLSNPASFSFSLGRTKTSFVDTQFSNNKSSEKVVQVSTQISDMTQEITEIKQQVDNKVGTSQGTDNNGKYLGVDEDGNVVPMDPPEEFSIHALTAKASVAEGDEVAIYGVNVSEHRKITWTTIKSTLKTYFNDLYAAVIHKHKVVDIEDFPDLSESYAEKDHTHTVENIDDFPNLEEFYAPLEHSHKMADIEDFEIPDLEIPEGIYAPVDHDHSVEDITDFPDLDNTYAGKEHKHKVEDIEDFPTIPSAAYQAEEVVVGSWFGAILYRRVFQIEALPVEAGSFSYPHGIEGIDLVTKIDGFMIVDGVTTYFSSVSASLTDIFYTLDTAAGSGTGYLIIEYTKQIIEEDTGENDG